jgi:GxxExxY protein
MNLNAITGGIIDAAVSVHRELGPGLLESTYETCMAIELRARAIPFERQKMIPLCYRGVVIEPAYRVDFVVSRAVVVELKAVDRLAPVHTAQILTYLRLTRCPIGLLINFNAATLRAGVRRVVLGYDGPRPHSPARPSVTPRAK